MIGFISPFKILDYIDRLEIVKETGSEYHCKCPVCGDGGFKIKKKTGKYQAFKCGCEVKDIREAIRPWKEVEGERQKGKKEKNSFNLDPFPFPLKQKLLARLPAAAEDIPQPNTDTEIPEWLQKQGIPSNATETRYHYSKTQWVSRCLLYTSIPLGLIVMEILLQ